MCMALSGGGWNGALSLWKIGGDLCADLIKYAALCTYIV